MTRSGDAQTSTGKFFVSFNGEVKGPFDLELIDAFILSGHYPEVVQIRGVDSDEWKPHSVIETTTPAPVTKQSPPRPEKNANIFTDWRLILGGVVVAFFVFKGMSSGESKPTSRYSSNTPRPYQSTPSTALPSTGSSQSKSRYVAPPATPADTLYKGADGRTYRVPHSEYPRLSRMKSALTEQKTSLDQFESQANALEAQITRDKELLDRTNQSQIDSYNQKIDRYNRTSEQLKSHIDSFNSGVNAFNAELKRVGTPTN
jgi:hypothetical protein